MEYNDIMSEEALETLPNGAKVDPITKKIVKAAPGSQWDSKKAREMALMRHARKAKAVRDAITDAVNSSDPLKEAKNFPDAAAAMVGQLVEEVALNSDRKPMDRVAVAKFALEQADDSPKTRLADLAGGDMGDAGMVISLSPATSEFVLNRLLEMKRGKSAPVPEIVEATFREVDSASS